MTQKRQLAHWCIPALGFLVLSTPVNAEPRWRSQLVAFDNYALDQGPWLTDPRLTERLHPDYPNDLMVSFPVYVGDVPAELMWVTVLDYDEETDTYLGKLLNQPELIEGLRIQDNVVFRPVETSGFPVALDDQEEFLAVAIPTYARLGVARDLYEGVRAYRLGNFGHNMPEIERCLAIFETVAQSMSELSPEDAYLASFLRGRCAAEAYETMLAIDSFRSALAIRPDDFYSNISLLAELSVAALSPDIQPKAEWEAAFVQHWQLIQEEYSTHPAIAGLRETLFNENSVSGAEPLTPEEIEQGKRLGFGVFRWKQR